MNSHNLFSINFNFFILITFFLFFGAIFLKKEKKKNQVSTSHLMAVELLGDGRVIYLAAYYFYLALSIRKKRA